MGVGGWRGRGTCDHVLVAGVGEDLRLDRVSIVESANVRSLGQTILNSCAGKAS